MQIYNQPPKSKWASLQKRPTIDTSTIVPKVKEILGDIKATGDQAVKEYTQQFDNVMLDTLAVSKEEIAAAVDQVDDSLKQAIQTAKRNIQKFHQSQAEATKRIETSIGIQCWRKSLPIQSVGLYIPAGTAPLFSTVLMLGVPAQLAGCEEVVLCSPPQAGGKINPVVLYTAQLVGCTNIYKVGGVQAIGAMAYGTASIPKVHKIFGPGNQYVTCAKQVVNQGGTAIDMPAGPSELLVWADQKATPAFVAADLLSQAEHGRDSQVILITNQLKQAQKVHQALQQQLSNLPRKEIAAQALQNSRTLILDEAAALAFINQYAPEHLIINQADSEQLANRIVNAGSVFLGNYTPESLGDYASGTNHTLPTNGFAKAYSGVSLDSFVKKITFQKATAEGLALIGPTVEKMAAAEQLQAHKNAVSIRLSNT